MKKKKLEPDVIVRIIFAAVGGVCICIGAMAFCMFVIGTYLKAWIFTLIIPVVVCVSGLCLGMILIGTTLRADSELVYKYLAYIKR